MLWKSAVACCACSALWVAPASAQEQKSLHPADPRTAMPSPAYRSAFDGYLSFRDAALQPWRAVNDDVARIGGHPGILGGGSHAGHGATNPAASAPIPTVAPPTVPASTAPAAHQGRHP